MNLNISNEQFNEMEASVANISRNYLKAIGLIKDSDTKMSFDTVFDNSNGDRYIKRVLDSYSKLNVKSKLIINNDFFYQTSFPNWWTRFFTPDAYYKGKVKAMISFLKNFENA